jgi:lysozyme
MQIKGIDVSHHNGVVDWKKVAADGVKFVFLKASEGTSFVDKTFYTNAAQASAAGIHVGAYHYAKFGTVAEARAEAKHFLKTVAGVKLTYPLVLDLEENKKNASKAVLTNAAVAFMQALENTGYVAMLYAGKYFLENTLDESKLKPYALWVARYNKTLGRQADVWQYTETGKVQGIKGNVDMNWAYRDFAQKSVSIDNEIKTIQEQLAKLGFNVGAADGIIGPKTKQAITAFQTANHPPLAVDGIAGPKTKALLNEKVAQLNKPAECTVVVSGVKLQEKGYLINDKAYVPVRALIEKGKLQCRAALDWNSTTRKILINRHIIDDTRIFHGDVGYAWAQDIKSCVEGLSVDWDQKSRTVTFR